MTNKVKQFEHRLRNTPNGIPYPEIPEDPEIIKYIQQLYRKDHGMWVKYLDNTWYFVLLRTPGQPPMGIKKWIWQSDL